MNDYRDLTDGMPAAAAATLLSAAADVSLLACIVIAVFCVLGVGLVVVLVLTATFARGSTRTHAWQVLDRLRPSSIHVTPRQLRIAWRDDPPSGPPAPADPSSSVRNPSSPEGPQG